MRGLLAIQEQNEQATLNSYRIAVAKGDTEAELAIRAANPDLYHKFTKIRYETPRQGY